MLVVLSTKTARSKAFTLVELLVVISIIALLMGILVPGLGLARDLGRRVYCGNTLKSIGQANMSYASTWFGYYVPYANPMRNNSGQIRSIKWCENPALIKMLFVSSYNQGNELGYFNWPDAYVCPSDKNTKAQQGASSLVLMSYGCNYYGLGITAGWSDTMPHPVSCKIDQVANPSEKLMYTEGTGDWWVSVAGANYILGWDRFRFATNQTYKQNNLHGAVAYRHTEGANVLFFDSHVEYRKKEKIYDWQNLSMWWTLTR